MKRENQQDATIRGLLLTTATNHIQQNQNNTPNAVTGPLFSLKMGIMMPETC